MPASPYSLNQQAYSMVQSLKTRREILDAIALGGGLAQLEKLKRKKKLSARQRIADLIDPGSSFTEIGVFAGYDMYPGEGGCPAGGLVAGIGWVSGRTCVIVANDPTVKAGAWFPITSKKFLRMQEIAMENRLPVIYLVDSAGVYLPLQEEVFPDKEHFGRVFYNNARLSALGITQIAAVLGSCVAGGAYLPIMSDETLMVEGLGSIFLAGPYLVRASIGEETDSETLGGAAMHTGISGIADYKFPDERSCLEQVRRLIGTLAHPSSAGFDRIPAEPPARDPAELYVIIPSDPSRPYDMTGIIDRLVDRSEFDSFKQDYGPTLLCGYARIEGWAVGIVANQRLVVKNRRGEMQMGGVIYPDSADKAARFILNCNQKKIPLLFLQDVTGFMVGSRAEQAGIIKDGAKMVNAVANSIVPKFTVIVGNSFGAGNYALCGKAYDPRLIFAWPSARIAVMGGPQAARTLLQIRLSGLRSQGRTLDQQEEQRLLQEITANYLQQSSPYYAAARLWVDDIIDPADTRRLIAEGIGLANQAPVRGEMRTGVFQV